MPNNDNELTRRIFVAAGTGATLAAGLPAVSAKPATRKIAGVPENIINAVREHARPLQGNESDYYPVLDRAREASFVLLGEASHGTHEFYATRAEMTRRLIREFKFNAVVIEGDWPDAARVNRFVQGTSEESAEQSLQNFNVFPLWMWRNTAVRDFTNWLREHNVTQQEGAVRAGFYGMDLYSLTESAEAVIRYLATVDAGEAARAEERYATVLRAGSDGQAYGAAVAYGSARSAKKPVREQLESLLRLTEGSSDAAAFDAVQNARLVVAAEEYYRGMYTGGLNTWNHRDRYMADTLDALAEHLRRRDGYARIAVWAHNSHLGDARATDSRRRGEWNVGQLMRERHEGQTLSIGFTTNQGTVMAADDWGSPGMVKDVRPSVQGSWERAFAESGIPAFVLNLREEAVARALSATLLERAIGVIYRPDTERQSHYFDAKLAEQFDAVIHFAETRAVEPLDASEVRTSKVEQSVSTLVR